MSPEGMYLWMAGVHGAKTPLWLGFLQRNLVAVFWTVGQQLLLVGKTKGHWEEVWDHSQRTCTQRIIVHPPPFMLLQVKAREV